MPWIVYILQCADMTLYTGITTDMAARLKKHGTGTGAKYTKGRGPYVIVFTEYHATRSEALKREHHIKTLSKAQKQALCRTVVSPA